MQKPACLSLAAASVAATVARWQAQDGEGDWKTLQSEKDVAVLFFKTWTQLIF